MKVIFTFSLLLVCSILTFGQQRTINGNVTDESGSALPGVSVVVTGTTTGTITDIDGNYSVNVSEAGASLTFSFIGMETQEVVLDDRKTYNVILISSTFGVDEVVVTALGIKKQARGLTYSTQKVAGDELTKAKDVNMINSIAGKTAGVVITRGAGGLGSSSKVVLRGNKSISGNNQVLYVIDGIPMNNANGEQASTLYDAYDGGDAISNMNPDDIESINVLKGASAAALYGSQAANGVILITTKSGKAGETKVNVSSSTVFEKVTSLPEIQSEYAKASDDAVDSWGAKKSGLSNSYVEDFFDTGVSSINSVSVSSGNEKSKVYMSYANTSGKGVISNNKLAKNNFSLRGNTKLTEKFTIDGSVNIINQDVENRPYAGYYFNPLIGLYLFPMGDDFNQYKEYETYNLERNLNVQNWGYAMGQSGLSFQNPYWVKNRNLNFSTRNRVISTFSGDYTINDWLSLKGRVNYDQTSDDFEQHIYATTDEVISHANGEYTKYNYMSSQLYSDVLLTYNKDINDNLNVNGAVGFSSNKTNRVGSRVSSYTDHLGNTYKRGLYYANFFAAQNINGSADFPKYEYDETVMSQAAFGNLQVGYNNMLFLDVSGRNEWSSTVDKTFFYPQVGGSFVVTELLDNKTILSYGKIRGSFAQVGNALPFGYANTNLIYDILPGGTPQKQQTIANPEKELMPEITNSIEFGAEMKFLDNKLSLDFTYYNSLSKDQVFPILAPQGASKAPYYYINGGEIRNKGVELSLGYSLRLDNGFKWDPTFYYSKNSNEVVSLDESLDQPWVVLTSLEQTKIYELRVVEGGAYGDMYGYKFQRDANGNIMKNDEGNPMRGEELEKIGNSNPDFMLSMTNNLSYKNFTLSFLIDGRFGGDVVSMTEAYLDERGLSQRSADARNSSAFTEGGTTFDPQSYYTTVGGSNNISEAYVFDATNIRLRELSFGYKFSTKNIFNGAIENLELSIVGRNLGFLVNKAPFDPELSLSAGNGLQGLEAFSMPSTRTLGFNVKLSF